MLKMLLDPNGGKLVLDLLWFSSSVKATAYRRFLQVEALK
jgi:hypothetical protein